MQNLVIDSLFLIDIETVSAEPDHQLLTNEWKELWAEKVRRTLPGDTTAEEYYPQRAAILAEFAKVVCISIGYFKKDNGTYKLRVKSFYGNDEKEILSSFNNTLLQMHSGNNKWCFAGHNIKEFDIPFLCRRMIANNIEIPFCLDFQNMKPWETPLIDTLHLWRFGDYKHYTSLKLLAATLNVPSPKTDIDGSQVGNVYWIEKNLARIAHYCQKDVATTANIILRFKNMPLLTDEQIQYVE
jgi:3'-5' exonuclease